MARPRKEFMTGPFIWYLNERCCPQLVNNSLNEFQGLCEVFGVPAVVDDFGLLAQDLCGVQQDLTWRA